MYVANIINREQKGQLVYVANNIDMTLVGSVGVCC
jgi:hypothetical protein